MTHPALAEGRVAVVTGAAMGIGLAACKRFALLGVSVCMADVDGEELGSAEDEVVKLAPGGRDAVLAVPTDVARVGENRWLLPMEPLFRRTPPWREGA